MGTYTEIRAAAMRAAADVAASPSTSTTAADVPAIAERVMVEVAPIVDHLTNNEDWFRSKVTLGNLTSIVGGTLAIAAAIKAGSWEPELYVVGISAILGGAFSLYGRWVARRPIGA